MPAELDYIKLFDQSIAKLFADALRLSLRHPDLAAFLLKAARWQKRAARTRQEWLSRGVRVPAFMIYSITKRCNLKCKGCYAESHYGSCNQMCMKRAIQVNN